MSDLSESKKIEIERLLAESKSTEEFWEGLDSIAEDLAGVSKKPQPNWVSKIPMLFADCLARLDSDAKEMELLGRMLNESVEMYSGGSCICESKWWGSGYNSNQPEWRFSIKNKYLKRNNNRNMTHFLTMRPVCGGAQAFPVWVSCEWKGTMTKVKDVEEVLEYLGIHGNWKQIKEFFEEARVIMREHQQHERKRYKSRLVRFGDWCAHVVDMCV